MSKANGSGTENVNYTYDAAGHRIAKEHEMVVEVDGEVYRNGSTAKYTYLGDTLTDMQWVEVDGSVSSFHFTYDATGPMSMTFYGTEYFYLKNAQGDVTGLVDSSGTQVVAYTYDAWGNILSTTGSMAGSLGYTNPFRYRSYFYDTETGLYYLGSRYYNPETGRFINADNLISGSKNGVSGNNVFSYCGNNPINKVDASGHWPQFINNVAKTVKKLVQKVVATVVSAKTSKPTSTSSTTLSKKSVKTSSAYIKRSHTTTPKAMLDMGPVVGKVGFSQTVTQQSNSPGLIYSYTDIGNDESRIGTGVNIAGQAGVSVGASSSGNVFVQVQVTKWAHAEISFGIDGIGLLTATDMNNISNNFEFQIGWGAALIMIMPELAAAGI